MKLTSPLCLVVVALSSLSLLCTTANGTTLRTVRRLEEEAPPPPKKKKKFFCANNGETYKKKFRLKEDGHKLACKQKCPCPKKKKFCGSNGETYVRKDKLLAANATVACRGKCPCKDGGEDVSAGSTDGEDCMCTAEMDPVCASDPMETDPALSKPKTFDNMCKADCAGFTSKECDGECPCKSGGGGASSGGDDCMCSADMEPVCASDPMAGDGKPKTFDNQCKANCAGYTLTECDGECPCGDTMVGDADCDCAEAADAPICVLPGTMEEATFRNFCEAECVGVDTKGACKGMCPCPQDEEGCVCNSEFKPVCVASGTASEKTFPNACEATCAGFSGFDCDGECPCPSPSSTPLDGCDCPATKSPYCGVDGNSYANACEVACAGTTIDCKGSCPCGSGGASAPEDCFCSAEYKPVCGSSGEDFSNECKALCVGDTVACEGKCPC